MESERKIKSRRTLIDSEEENTASNDENQNYPGIGALGHQKDGLSGPNKMPVVSQIEEGQAQKRKKIKKKSPAKEEDVEKYCLNVMSEMRDLYKRDLISSADTGKVHLKIDNIEQICAKIIKKNVQSVFIKMGILKELKIWLEPLPDNSLPNPKIKRAIIDLLYHLKISKGDLLTSGIGKILHFYSKNPKEALDIRKASNSIVKKWKSMIIREEIEQ